MAKDPNMKPKKIFVIGFSGVYLLMKGYTNFSKIGMKMINAMESNACKKSLGIPVIPSYWPE